MADRRAGKPAPVAALVTIRRLDWRTIGPRIRTDRPWSRRDAGRSSDATARAAASECLDRAAFEQQVSLGRLVGAKILGALGHGVGGLVEARGVDQHDGEPIAVAEFAEVVAGGARRAARQWLVAAEESVEEPALAGVWRSGEHDARMAGGPLTLGESRADVRKPRRGACQFLGQDSRETGIDVGLFGEIEIGFEVGDQVEQAVAQSGDRDRKTAGELLKAARAERGCGPR